MTVIFGTDISSYQEGLDLSRLRYSSFVLAKATEGTYYTDSCYDGWRRQAASLGTLFGWYHFLSGEDVHAQVAHCLAKVGDKSLPGMLDVEETKGYTPTLQQAIAWIDAAHAEGLNLRLGYIPRWLHQQWGSPSLTGLRDRGVALVASSYPGGSGTPADIYPGDEATGWQAYGGMTPLLYQFTNQASDGGQLLDYNAVRGSVDQLAAFLHTTAPSPAPTPATPSSDPKDDDMPAFVTGEIKPGAGVTTVVCPPPANLGAAGWGNVWFSLGTDFGDAHVRVAIFVHGQGWSHIYEDVLVKATDDRTNPFGGPLPAGVQKISVTRVKGTENVPMGYLIEAAHR